MGEGVDPTQMCQRLVDKVAQSKQLLAMTDPDLLVLFEDWFEELEEEIISLVGKHGPLNPRELAEKPGSRREGQRSSFPSSNARESSERSQLPFQEERLFMQNKKTTLIAFVAVLLTIGVLWFTNRAVTPKPATWDDVLAEARNGGYKIITTEELSERYRNDG